MSKSGFGKSTDLQAYAGDVSLGNVRTRNVVMEGTVSLVDKLNNVKMGTDALKFVTTGTDSIAFGTAAGYFLTTGSENILMGPYAGYQLAGGSYCIIVGNDAAYSATNANSLTIIGSKAMRMATGPNVANNVVVGAEAASRTPTLFGSVVVGYRAADAVRSYTGVYIGELAGGPNPRVSWFQTCVGPMSGYDDSGIGSCAFGLYAGAVRALNLGDNTSNYNTCIGPYANVLAVDADTGSNGSLAVGFSAKASGNNCIAVGYSTTNTCANSVKMGNALITDGRLGPGLGWTTMSDSSLIENVVDDDLGTPFVRLLRPRRFNFKSQSVDIRTLSAATPPVETHNVTTHTFTDTHYGLVANEVKGAIDAMGKQFAGYRSDAGPLGLRPDQFIAPMITAIKDIDTRTAGISTVHGVTLTGLTVQDTRPNVIPLQYCMTDGLVLYGKRRGVRQLSVNGAVNALDDIVLCDCSTESIILVLPVSMSQGGQQYTIWRTDNSEVTSLTLQASPGEGIQNRDRITIQLDGQDTFVTLLSAGTGLWVLV